MEEERLEEAEEEEVPSPVQVLTNHVPRGHLQQVIFVSNVNARGITEQIARLCRIKEEEEIDVEIEAEDSPLWFPLPI